MAIVTYSLLRLGKLCYALTASSMTAICMSVQLLCHASKQTSQKCKVLVIANPSIPRSSSCLPCRHHLTTSLTRARGRPDQYEIRVLVDLLTRSDA